MSQRDRVSVDENLLYQESKDLLALSHIQRIRAPAQLTARSGQVFGQLQVVGLVDRGHLQGLWFRLDGLFPQIRHANACPGTQRLRLEAVE